MELTLERGEAEVLRILLSNRLSDLRDEISNTENHRLREALKREEITLKSLIARLGRLERGQAA